MSNIVNIEKMSIDQIQEYIQSLAYATVATKNCISTLAVSTATPTATVTVVHPCPVNAISGTSYTVGATITNTSTINNNAFVMLIQINVLNTDGTTGVSVASKSSGNLTILAGATSAETTLTFTHPASKVLISYTVQVEPAGNY